MQQDEWERLITEDMEKCGWKKDRDDETTLGFCFPEGDCNWIRDYDKKTRRFVQFNGNQMVRLVTKK